MTDRDGDGQLHKPAPAAWNRDEGVTYNADAPAEPEPVYPEKEEDAPIPLGIPTHYRPSSYADGDGDTDDEDPGYDFSGDLIDGDGDEDTEILTPRVVQDVIDQDRRGYKFVLHHTRNPENGKAQAIIVRKVNFQDRLVIKNLPGPVRKIIEGIMNTSQTNARTNKNSWLRLQQNLGRAEELANAYLVAAAIEPRFFLTQAEANAAGGICVKDVNIADRQALMTAMESTRGEAAARLIPFRGRSVLDVEGRQDDQEVAGTY